MAQDIKRGTQTIQDQTTYVTSKTFAHVNDGADILLRVLLHGNGVALSGFTATYNGVSMTLLGTSSDGTNFNYALMFYLKNASAGSNNVVVSWTNQGKGSFLALSLTGVAGYRTANTAGGGGTSVSNSPTTVPGDVVLDAVMYWSSPLTTLTVGASQTQEKNTQLTDIHVAASYANASSSGSTTAMTWTLGATRTWVSIALPLYGAEVGGIAVSPLYWI